MKQIIVFLLALMMILTLSACGEKASESGNSQTQFGENESETEKTPSSSDKKTQNDPISSEFKEEDYLIALDEYLGHPVEHGWSSGNYLTKLAADSENIYWKWIFGGGHGTVVQRIANPKSISVPGYSDSPSGPSIGSKIDLIQALNQEQNGFFIFDDIYLNGKTTITYNGETVNGDIWIFRDQDGKETEYVFAEVLAEEFSKEEITSLETWMYYRKTIFKAGNRWAEQNAMDGGWHLF